MNIFLEDDETEEIKPVSESDDKAIVINPKKNEESRRIPELVKEMSALDGLELTIKGSAEIHDVSKSQIQKYTNGIGIKDEDARARIAVAKHGIVDTATAKLMETLDLIDPQDMTTKNQIALLGTLSRLVETGSAKDKEGNKAIHLYLYGPDQKKEKDYKIIDVN